MQAIEWIGDGLSLTRLWRVGLGSQGADNVVQSNTGREIGTKIRGFDGVFSPCGLSFGSGTEHELGCYVELPFVYILLQPNSVFIAHSGMTSGCVSSETISVAVNDAFVQMWFACSVCPLSQYSDPFGRGYPTATATAEVYTFESIRCMVDVVLMCLLINASMGSVLVFHQIALGHRFL